MNGEANIRLSGTMPSTALVRRFPACQRLKTLFVANFYSIRPPTQIIVSLTTDIYSAVDSDA